MMNYDAKLIAWSDEFLCGIEVIDKQHKALINLINSLLSNVTGNQETDKPYFNKVIYNVIKCIKAHLSTEEKVLFNAKYPLYVQHKKAHKTFLMTILDIANDYKTGKCQNLTIISNYFKNWALSHIAIMDRAYFEYFKK